jgi:hypothetical protein
MVPKSLTQGVAAVVALKVDGPAPGFDKPVHGRDGQNLAAMTEEEGGVEASKTWIAATADLFSVILAMGTKAVSNYHNFSNKKPVLMSGWI